MDKKKEEGVMDLTPLMDVVRTLRSPGGCPWDQAQDHKSMRRELVEEVYELLEAIDDGDVKGIREELGDVLFQVVFHARLAEEVGAFTMQDVITDVSRKLIHRHPHVYPHCFRQLHRRGTGQKDPPAALHERTVRSGHPHPEAVWQGC